MIGMQFIDRIKKAYQVVSGISLPKEELSHFDSPYYALSQLKPYNPDELVNRKGGLDVYRLMLTDDMVKAALHIKKLSVISSGYKIEPGSEDKKNVDIAKKIEYDLTDGMVGNFNKNLRDILSAMEYGFSVTEIIPQIYKDGEYKGLIGIKQLKTRPPHSFEFHTDKFNNIEKLRQNTSTGFLDFLPDRLKYFLIYSYNSDFGNWHGTSDLRAAYRPWWSKDLTVRFLNIFNERFGMGIVVGRYPRGMGKTEQDDLEKMIENIQAKTSFKLPENVKVEILESTKRGASAFIESINKFDMMISRAILLPNLAGYGENVGGSYALGETQLNLYFLVLDAIRNELEELFNESLVPQLVDWNYANVSKYPKFKFKPLTQKDKNALATLFLAAWEKGAIKATEEDEEYLRGILEFPKRNKDSILIERPQVAVPINPNQNSMNPVNDDEKIKQFWDESLHPRDEGGKFGEKGEVKNELVEYKTGEWFKKWTWSEKGTMKPNPDPEVLKFLNNNNFKSDENITVYRGITKGSKMDMAEQYSSWTIDRKYASMYSKTVLEKIVSPNEVLVQMSKLPFKFRQHTISSEVILKPTGSKLKKFSRRPNKYENKVNFTKIEKQLDDLEYEYGLELGKLITKTKDDLTSTIIRRKIIEDRDVNAIEKIDLKYVGDMRLFWKDTLRKLFIIGRKDAKSELPKNYVKIPIFGNLPPKDALVYFERKAFYLAGTEKDFILKNVKSILYDGMKTGISQEDVLYSLEEFFEQYKVEQMLPDGKMENIEDIPGRLDTIIRTNFNDAYNQGRLAMFQDEDVKDFIVAYEFSAIMDDRTSDICEELDGKIYKTNNPIWNKIIPPNHFNCRSILVPILSDEEFDGEDDLPDLSLLRVGFGG